MRKRSAAIGAIALSLVVVALVALSIPERGTEVELLETLQDHEQSDPKFAGCVGHLRGEGMELVMEVDNSCGDVFTASECPLKCHTAAQALAQALGCCWPTLIEGFSKVQPSAAHAWHSWAFNLENLCGVSFTGSCQASSFSKEKSIADSALTVAQQALLAAKKERKAAMAARKAANLAQDQAKKLQKEMKSEVKQFKKMRKHFRLSRADAARAMLVERMVHNSVKKDLSKAWGLHKQVSHDSKIARRLAAGTQVQQANAKALLKSAHAAKDSVYKMAKMAIKEKRAAYRLHKIALEDIQKATEIEVRAKLQRAIAKKAAQDVQNQLKMSDKIIKKSKADQKNAKKLWAALQDEQKSFQAEQDKATDGVADEEGLDKKMDAEMEEAAEQFEKFGKEADGVEAAVAHAEDLAEHAADISAQSEELLTQTQQQQDEIDKERGWLMQQQAQVLSGRKGLASLDGQLDVVRRKYYTLRKALSDLEYETKDVPLTPPRRKGVHYFHYHQEGYINPSQQQQGGDANFGAPLPLPPRSYQSSSPTHEIYIHAEGGYVPLQIPQ